MFAVINIKKAIWKIFSTNVHPRLSNSLPHMDASSVFQVFPNTVFRMGVYLRHENSSGVLLLESISMWHKTHQSLCRSTGLDRFLSADQEVQCAVTMRLQKHVCHI